MKRLLASTFISVSLLCVAASASEMQELRSTLIIGGQEKMTLVASTCSQWITVTIDFDKGICTQTCISLTSYFNWWDGTENALGNSPKQQSEPGKWILDPYTYQMVWQQPGLSEYGQEYCLASR